MVQRIDKEKALTWTFEEVLDQWYRLFLDHVLANQYKAGVSVTQAELQTLNELV